MFIVTAVLAVVLALAFLGAGLAKLTKQKAMVEASEHLGFTIGQYQLIGAAEVAAAAGLLIGLWFAPLGIAAAVGLVLLMAGAVYFHLRTGDPAAVWSASAGLGVISLIELVLRVSTS